MANNTNNKKIVFGQEVDLNDYKNLDTTASDDNGKHSHYGWLPLSGYDQFDPDDNTGIREEQNLGRDTDDFTHELKVNGWDTQYAPPKVDLVTDLVTDGRKRELCFIFGKQEFMPVEYRIYPDQSEKTKVAAGLLGNLANVTTDRAKPEDIFVGLKRLLNAGEIEHTAAAAHQYFAETLKGVPYNKFEHKTLEKQVNRFLALNRDGTRFMKTLERSAAEAYVKAALKNMAGFSDFTLYTAPGPTNVARALTDHILPNAVSGKHTNLVLYIQSTPTDPVEVTKAMHAFKSNLDISIAQCGDLVERSLTEVTLKNKPFSTDCYTIVGCIPQKNEDPNHVRRFNSRELIDLSDY